IGSIYNIKLETKINAPQHKPKNNAKASCLSRHAAEPIFKNSKLSKITGKPRSQVKLVPIDKPMIILASIKKMCMLIRLKLNNN
ncbi:hypothetical protein, partial [Pseudoalteromonas sp.]|uniref:hypothetical protein n=1 Tax=Pseudoalteromonas sp. TaxID=53249 RepID=UPI003565D27C